MYGIGLIAVWFVAGVLVALPTTVLAMIVSWPVYRYRGRAAGLRVVQFTELAVAAAVVLAVLVWDGLHGGLMAWDLVTMTSLALGFALTFLLYRMWLRGS